MPSTDDYEEAVEHVELAMDDHARARNLLQDAEERVTTKGMFAAAVAEGIYRARDDLEGDYEEFANLVQDYLMHDRREMDDRAVELAKQEEVIDKLIDELAEEDSSGEFPVTRREAGLGLGAVLATVIGANALTAGGGGGQQPRRETYSFSNPDSFLAAVDKTQYSVTDYIPPNEWAEQRKTEGPEDLPDLQRIASEEPISFDYSSNGGSTVSVTWEVYDTGEEQYDENSVEYDVRQEPADALASAAQNLEGDQNADLEDAGEALEA
ncbi:MAG: hypothetical protein ABEJ07_03760 [Candidatus Nanohaloarchaea archaeon]